MYRYWLLIYPALLLILLFWNCRISKIKNFVEDPWNHKQSGMLQAACCIGIIIHHITQHFTNYAAFSPKNPITIFNNMGILFTSVFFFYSGYGLIVSVNNKEKYIDNFIWHRLPTVLVPFLTTNLIYILNLIYIENIPMAPDEFFMHLFGVDLINGNSWFIVEILILYISFFIFFKLIKNRDVASILLCITTIVIIYIGYRRGHDVIGHHILRGEWWYNSTATFIFGIIVARFRERIILILKKCYWFLLPLVSILLIVMFKVEGIVLLRYGYYVPHPFNDHISGQQITYIVQTIFCLTFILFTLLVGMKVSIGNKVLGKISAISLELYLIHGLFITYQFNKIKATINWKYGIILLISIIAAFLIYLLDRLILKGINAVFNGKKYHTECNGDLLRIKSEKRLEKIKKTVTILVLVSVFVWLIAIIYIYLIRPYYEYNSEMEAIRNSNEGDIVYFGRYDTDYKKNGRERLSWIVLYKDENSALLITEKGIAGHPYDSAWEEVSWKESEMYQMLNGDMYISMFSKYEKDVIMDNYADGSRLSLLSPDEAENLFYDDESRELQITEAAITDGNTYVNNLSKVNNWGVKNYRSSWWWLRGDNKKALLASFVSVDGTVERDSKNIYVNGGAIRPIVWVSLTSLVN